MPASLAPFFNTQFFTDDGEVAAGYLLYSFATGTSTPKDTYTEQSGAGSENTNPIVLDAAGRCALWLDDDGSEYAFELRTPADALVERWDDVAGVPVPSDTEFVPIAGGVQMTDLFELSGPATSDLNPVTLGQLNDELAEAATANEAAIAAALPVGTVLMCVSGAVPTGWLALEGGNVSRTTYADLFDLWGTTFGIGDGSTTFGLPDTRGYFMRGWDNGRGVDSGRAIGTFQDDALQNIVGTLGLIHGGDQSADGPFLNDGATNAHIDSGTSGTDPGVTFDASRTVRTASETRPKNLAVRFIVRALGA